MKSDKRFSARRVFGAAVLGAFGALLLVIPGASSGDARSPAARAGGANSALYTEWARAGGGAAGVKFGSFAVSRPAGEAVVGDLAEKFKGILSESVLVDGDDVREYLNARARARVMDAAEERFSDWWSARRAGLDDKLLTAGADYVTEYLTAAAGARAERFRFVRTIEVDFKSGVGERRWQSGLSALGALRETERDALAWQLRGYGAEESAYGANAGLIYRWLPVAAGGSLAGVNVFLDYEQHGDYDESFWRWSLGGEYRNAYIDVYANQYWAITDAVEQGGDVIYTQDGREVQLNLNAGGLFKRLGALSGGLTWYKWDGEFGEDDDEGLRYHLRLSPAMSGLRLELELDSPEGGDLDWGGNISYTHTFGAPPAGVSAAESADFDARAHFFEPVRREYAQRIRRVENVGANNQITAVVITGTAAVAVTNPGTPDGGTLTVTTSDLVAGTSVSITIFTRRHTVSVGTGADPSTLALTASNWQVTIYHSTTMHLQEESTRLSLEGGTVYIDRDSGLNTLVAGMNTVVLLGTELEFGYAGTPADGTTNISLVEGLIAMTVDQTVFQAERLRYVVEDTLGTVNIVEVSVDTTAGTSTMISLNIGCETPSQRRNHRSIDGAYNGCAGDAFLSEFSTDITAYLSAAGETATLVSVDADMVGFSGDGRAATWPKLDGVPFSPDGARIRTSDSTGNGIFLNYTAAGSTDKAALLVRKNSTLIVRTRPAGLPPASEAVEGIDVIVRGGEIWSIGDLSETVSCGDTSGYTPRSEHAVNVIAACDDVVTFLDADGNAYTAPLNFNSRVGTGRLITVDVAGGDDGGYNFSITPSGGALRLVNASGASLVLTLDASAVLTANFTVRAVPTNETAAEFVEAGTLTVAVNVASEFALRAPDITPVVATELMRDVALFTLTLEGNIGPESASGVSLASSDPAGVANLFTVGDINNGRVIVALTSSGPLGSAGQISLVIGATETLGDDFPGNTGGVLNGSYMLTLTVQAAAPGAVTADFAYAGSGANISLASDGTDSAADHAAYSVGETGALVVVSNARNLPVFGVSLSGGDYSAGIAGTPPTGFQIEGLELHLADTPPGPGPYTMTLEVGDGHSTSGSAQFIVTVVLVDALAVNPTSHDRTGSAFNVTVRGLAVATVTAEAGVPPYSYAIAGADPAEATAAFSVDGSGEITYNSVSDFVSDTLVTASVRVTDRLGAQVTFVVSMTTTAPLATNFAAPERQILHYFHRGVVFYRTPAGAIVGGESPYTYGLAEATGDLDRNAFDVSGGNIQLVDSLTPANDGDTGILRLSATDSATPAAVVTYDVPVLIVDNEIDFAPASASVAVLAGHTGNITTIARANWNGDEVLGAISYRLTGTAPSPVGVNVANRQVATPSALAEGEYVLTLAAEPSDDNIHGIAPDQIIGFGLANPHFILTVHAVASVSLSNDTRQLRFDDDDANQAGQVVYDLSDALTGGSGDYTYRLVSNATMATDGAAANVGLNTATGEVTLSGDVNQGTAGDDAELTLIMEVEVSDDALSSTARGTLMLIWGTGLGLSAPTQARHLATELPHTLDIVTLTAGGASGTAAETTASVISVNPSAEAGKFNVRRIADDEYEWAVTLNGGIASPLTVTVVVGATEDLTGDANDSSATVTVTVIAEHPGAVSADFAYVGSGASVSLDSEGNQHAVYSTGETGALVEISNIRNLNAASGMSISGGEYDPGLPDGVSFMYDGLQLKLTSTPPDAGAYTVITSVDDDHTQSPAQSFTVSVLLVDPVSLVTDAYPPDAVPFPSFSTEATDLMLATISVGGGAAPYNFTIFGADPASASAAFTVAYGGTGTDATLVFSGDPGFAAAVAVTVTARVTDALGGTADFELNVTTTAPFAPDPTFTAALPLAGRTVHFSHREAFFTPTVGSFVGGTTPYTYAVGGVNGLDETHFEFEADGGIKLAAAVAAGDAGALGTLTVRVSDSATPTPATYEYEVPVRIAGSQITFTPPSASVFADASRFAVFYTFPEAAWSGDDFGGVDYTILDQDPPTGRIVDFGNRQLRATGDGAIGFWAAGETYTVTMEASPSDDNLHGFGADFVASITVVARVSVNPANPQVTRRYPGPQAVEDAPLYDFAAATEGGAAPYTYEIVNQGVHSEDAAAVASAKIGEDDGMLLLAANVTSPAEAVITLSVDVRVRSSDTSSRTFVSSIQIYFRPAGRLSDPAQPLIVATVTEGQADLEFVPSDPSGTNEPVTLTLDADGAADTQLDAAFSSPPYNLSAAVAAGGTVLLEGDGYTVTLAENTTVSVVNDGATLHLVGGSVGIARDGGGILDDASTTAGTNLPLSGVSILISIAARGGASDGFALRQFDTSGTQVHSVVLNADNAKALYSGVHDISLHARSAGATVVIQTPEWVVTLHGNTTVSLTGGGTTLHIIGGMADIDREGGLAVVRGGDTEIRLSGTSLRAAVPGAPRQARALRRVAADMDVVLSEGMIALTMTSETAAYFEMDDENSTIMVKPAYLGALADTAATGISLTIYGAERAALASEDLMVGCGTREQRDNRRLLHGLGGGFARIGGAGFRGCAGDVYVSGIPAGEAVLLRRAGAADAITLVGRTDGVSAEGRPEVWSAYPFSPAGATLDTAAPAGELPTLTRPLAVAYNSANALDDTPRVVVVTNTLRIYGYKYQENRFFRRFVGFSNGTVTTTLTVAGSGEYGAAALVAGGSTVAFSLPAGVTDTGAATHITAALLAGEMLNVEGAADASCIAGADPQARSPDFLGALRVYAACAGGVRFAAAPYGTVTIRVPAGDADSTAQATLALGGGGGNYNFAVTPLGAGDSPDVTTESGGVLVLTVDTSAAAEAALYRVAASVPGGAVGGYTVPPGTITVEINIGARGYLLDEGGGRLAAAPDVVLPTRLLRQRALFTLAFPPVIDSGEVFRLSIAGVERRIESPFTVPRYAAPGLPAVVSLRGALPAAAGQITVSVAYREVLPHHLTEDVVVTINDPEQEGPPATITLINRAGNLLGNLDLQGLPPAPPEAERAPVSGVFEFVLTTEHPGAVTAEVDDDARMSVGTGGDIPLFALSKRDALVSIVNARNLPAASGAALSGLHDGYERYTYGFVNGEGAYIAPVVIPDVPIESFRSLSSVTVTSHFVGLSSQFNPEPDPEPVNATIPGRLLADITVFRITRQGRVLFEYGGTFPDSIAGDYTLTVRVADSHDDTAPADIVTTMRLSAPPTLEQYSDADYNRPHYNREHTYVPSIPYDMTADEITVRVRRARDVIGDPDPGTEVTVFTVTRYLATVISQGGVADGAGTYDIAGVSPKAAAGMFQMRAPETLGPANRQALYFAQNPDGITGDVVVTVRITDAAGGVGLLDMTVHLDDGTRPDERDTGETFTRNFDVPSTVFVAAGYTGAIFAPEADGGEAPVSGGTPPYRYTLHAPGRNISLHSDIESMLGLDRDTGTLYARGVPGIDRVLTEPRTLTLWSQFRTDDPTIPATHTRPTEIVLPVGATARVPVQSDLGSPFLLSMAVHDDSASLQVIRNSDDTGYIAFHTEPRRHAYDTVIHIMAPNYRFERQTEDGLAGYSALNLPLLETSAAGALATISANLRPANSFSTTLLAGDALRYVIAGVASIPQETGYPFPPPRVSADISAPPPFDFSLSEGGVLSLDEPLTGLDRARSRWVVTVAALPPADFAHDGTSYVGFESAPGLLEITLDYLPPLTINTFTLTANYPDFIGSNGYPIGRIDAHTTGGINYEQLVPARANGGSGRYSWTIVSHTKPAGIAGINPANDVVRIGQDRGGSGQAIRIHQQPSADTSIDEVTVTAVLMAGDSAYPEVVASVAGTAIIILKNENYAPPTPTPAPEPGYLVVIGGGGNGNRAEQGRDIFYSDSGDWHNLPPAPFGGRHNHMAAVLNGTLFVAGGTEIPPPAVGDVWASIDGAKWRQVGGLPGARTFPANLIDAQMVAHGGNLIISGGEGGGAIRRLQSKVWSSGDGENWTNIVKTVAVDQRFAARRGHVMVSHGGELFVIGGGEGSSDSPGWDEVWRSSDGVAWTAIGTAGSRFGQLRDMAAVSFGGSIYISGGRRAVGGAAIAEVWSSADGTTWQRETADLGAAVRGHAMVVSGDSMYIIGGGGSALWSSTNGADWSEVADNAFRDADRRGHAAVAFTPADDARPSAADIELPAALEVLVTARAGDTIARLGQNAAVTDTGVTTTTGSTSHETLTPDVAAAYQYRLLGSDPASVAAAVSVLVNGDIILLQNINAAADVTSPASLTVEVRYGIGAALTVREIVLTFRDRDNSGDGSIFIIGGNRAAFTDSTGAAVAAGNAADLWQSENIAAGLWDELPAAPFGARQNHMAATLGGSVFVAGGSETGDVWASPDGANWQRVAANVPFLRGLHRAQMVAHNNSLYVTGDRVGGRAGVGGRLVCDGALVTVRNSDGSVAQDCSRQQVVRYVSSGGAISATITRDGEETVVCAGRAEVVEGKTVCDSSTSARIEVVEERVCRPRVTHTCRYVDDGGARKGEVWASADGIAWTLVNENAPAHRKFDARGNHAMVSHGGSLFVIGGNDGGGSIDNNRLNDVWASTDGAMWTLVNNPDAAGMFPERYEHAAAVFSGRIYIVGGVTGSREVAGDVWSSADGIRWRQESAEAFGGRGHLGHVLLPIGDKMYIIGGAGNSDAAGRGDSPDLWSSENGKVWTRVGEPGTPPFAAYRRINHAAVVLP